MGDNGAALNETVAAATLMRRDAGHCLMMEDGARKQKLEVSTLRVKSWAFGAGYF